MRTHKRCCQAFTDTVLYNSTGRWGGIWSAPISYKFDTFSSVQTKVKLTKKFDDWTLGTNGVANRMPHIIQNWLTTQKKAKDWGSITGEYSLFILVFFKIEHHI